MKIKKSLVSITDLVLLFISSDTSSSSSKMLYVDIGFSYQQSSAFGCFRVWSELFRLLFLSPTIPHWLSSLSPDYSVRYCVNLLEYFLHWWMQAAFLSSYVGFSAVVRRGYDLVLISKVCLRVFCTMGYLGIPLLCFAYLWLLCLSMIINLLCVGSVCSFVRRCGLICLVFHERGTSVVSCICPYQYSPRKPHALRFVPAIVGWGATTMFLNLLYWKYWAVTCCPWRGARFYCRPVLGVPALLFLPCYTLYITNGRGWKARDSHVHALADTILRLCERAETPERSEMFDPSPPWKLAPHGAI